MKSIIFICVCSLTAVTTSPLLNFNSNFTSPKGEIFRADFTKDNLADAFDGADVQWGENNANIWASGLGMDCVYPAGSYGGSSGGFGLNTHHKVSGTAVFKYSVFFPDGFNFVKGGKLPGIYGGKNTCSGGDPALDCFSTRIMWRKDGRGELYLYANFDAQDQSICDSPNNDCNPDYGWSLDRGAFTFSTGVWTNLEIRLSLNTPGQRNGILAIKHNGEEVIRYDNLVFRVANYPNLIVNGLHVKTFFGGGSSDFATPTRQVTKFKDFILSSE